MLTIGEHTYSDGDIQVRGEMNNVTIGKYCSIGKNIVIDGGFQHRTDTISTYPFFNRFGVGEQNAYAKGDVIIGNDVWIGEDVMIMSGVKIWDGAIIGARSIVTKDVMPYEIVAGSPAKYIKHRLPICQANELLKIKWWDFTDVSDVYLLSIDEFIKKYGKR